MSENLRKKQILIFALILAISVPLNLFAATTLGNTLVIDGNAAEALLVRKASDGGDIFKVDTSDDGEVTITGIGTDTSGPTLTLFHDKATPDQFDGSFINFDGKDSAGNQTTFARVKGTVIDDTDGNELGAIFFNPNIGGSLDEGILFAFLDGANVLGSIGSDNSLNLAADDGSQGSVILSPGSAGYSIINNTYALPTQQTAGSENEAIDLNSFTTIITTDGDGTTHSLADGTQVGQMKALILGTDGGGNAVITPTTFLNGASITLDDSADLVQLYWAGDSTGWVVVSNVGATVS